MRTDYKDAKGVIVLMCGDTQNTFPYENNEDLFSLLERFIKNDEKGIDVYDFTERFIFYVFSEEDIEELKKELGGK